MKYNILIVEDDKLLQRGLVASLESLEVEITVASSGNEAIEKIEDKNFHLVITDIMMDNLDGFDLIKYINNSDKKIPFFIISSLGNNDDILKGYSLKIIDYITKPVNFELLNKKVQNFLEYTYPNTSSIQFHKSKNMVIIEGEEYTLTTKEYDLLEYLYK